MFAAATAVAFSSCSSSKARISGRFIGSDDRKVYLEQVTLFAQHLADSTTLDKIATSLPEDADARREALTNYRNEYVRIKQEQLRFIVEHKDRMAAVYALYQRIPGEQNLFNGEGDVVYYKTVADAVEERYPDSPYVPALRSEIARWDARINIAQQIVEMRYPDIEMPDMYGHKKRLSSLEGKVILLDFWSAELGNSNALNAELKRIYEEYADKGFEIFQVSVDTSKPVWVSAVQEQALPWISVCDFKGNASQAVGSYNLQKVPSNFLFDREGNIVGKDLYGDTLEKELQRLTAK